MEIKLDTLKNATIKILDEKYKNAKEKLENDIKKLQKHIDEL
jgi:hypothetical protein